MQKVVDRNLCQRMRLCVSGKVEGRICQEGSGGSNWSINLCNVCTISYFIVQVPTLQKVPCSNKCPLMFVSISAIITVEPPVATTLVSDHLS